MPTTVRVDINHAALHTNVPPILTRHMRRVLRLIAARAREIAPVRTGALRRSISATREIRTSQLIVSGEVKATSGHALYVHEGTRAHRIPKIGNTKAKILHFYWARMGREVFFKSVNHPETKPNPFLIRAAREVTRHG